MEEKKHRIAYAYYSEILEYKKSAPSVLEKQSEVVVPEEFSEGIVFMAVLDLFWVELA